jgi:integrase/recombinase XerD
VQGSLGGEYVKQSLNLTSWEAASARIAAWNARGELGSIEIPSIAEAVSKYMDDARARHLRPATLAKLRRIFEKDLLGFAKDKGYKTLRQLDSAAVAEFRARWKDGPLAATKKFERVIGFFYFCVRNDWLSKNPALSLQRPKATQTPTMPFSSNEWSKICEAVPKYPIKGVHGVGNVTRVRALVLLLRYSGLRIGDAVALDKGAVKDGRLFLRTAKTGVPVFIPLPEECLLALEKAARLQDGDYFFWTGRGLLKSAVADWQRTLRRLFEIAGISGHAHMFRDTFAISLLLSGVPLDQVALLLGHKNSRITEKHYAPWVKARQDALEAAVRKTW